jgi:ferric-dicitrate binding protein FerR (iron transport regulator)
VSRLDCERWASLFDRRTVGDELSPEELSFSRQHEASCSECRRELGVWESFGGVVAERPPAPKVDALALTDLLRQKLAAENAPSPPATPVSASRRTFVRRATYVGGALALAASVALVVRSKPDPARALLAEVHVTLASGDAAVERDPARAGVAVREGATLRAAGGPLCVSIEPAVRACLADGAEAILGDASLAHRRFDLKKGRVSVSLDPQPPGASFTVSTDAGTVTAVGTLFSVEIPTDGASTIARVVHGVVDVRPRHGGSQSLRAHEAMALDAAAPRELVQDEEQRDAALARLGEVAATDPKSARVDVRSAPLAGMVTIDGVALGRSPISIALAVGAHRVEMSGDAAPVSETIELHDGEQLERSFDLSAAPEATAPAGEGPAARATPSPETSAAPRESAASMLEQARQLRASGRFQEAVAVYRKLESSYRGSREAITALVSLGDLQLSRLHDAGGALNAFDAYLASGDKLLWREAQYGRIQALRSLGRSADERRAIEELLKRYPTGVQKDALRARLVELGGSP